MQGAVLFNPVGLVVFWKSTVVPLCFGKAPVPETVRSQGEASAAFLSREGRKRSAWRHGRFRGCAHIHAQAEPRMSTPRCTPSQKKQELHPHCLWFLVSVTATQRSNFSYMLWLHDDWSRLMNGWDLWKVRVLPNDPEWFLMTSWQQEQNVPTFHFRHTSWMLRELINQQKHDMSYAKNKTSSTLQDDWQWRSDLIRSSMSSSAIFKKQPK